MEIQCGSKDEMLKVILVLLFATTILCNGNVTDDCALQNTKSEQPINQLANVVRFFNTTELCDHNCNASTWIDDYGSVQISFTTNLKTGENPGKIIFSTLLNMPKNVQTKYSSQMISAIACIII